MASLYKIDNSGARAQRWDINWAPVVIGRSAGANIRIDDDSMSRRHLVIVRQEEGFVLSDLNSRNGTWVDGARVASLPLRNHDTIQAGTTMFLFEDAMPTSSRSGPHGTVLVQAA